MRTTTKIVISLIPSKYRKNTTVFLLIDNTLQPKFESRYKFFDHAKHNGSLYMNGHQIVSIAMTIPIYKDNEINYLTIPLGYKLYDKNFLIYYQNAIIRKSLMDYEVKLFYTI